MRRPRIAPPLPERVLARPGDINWVFRSGGSRSSRWFAGNGYRPDGHKVPVHLVAMFVRALHEERFEVGIEPGDWRPTRGTRQPQVVVVRSVSGGAWRRASLTRWLHRFEYWTHRTAIILISTAALVILSADLFEIMKNVIGDPSQ